MVIGQKTMFVRVAGCDYSCSWCDSAFTWNGTGKNEIRMMNPEEIWAELTALGGHGFSNVTLSGGNPALLKNISELIRLLNTHQIKVCLETQGSKWQDWFYDIDELTISPKPPSSKMITDFSMLDMILEKLKHLPPAHYFCLKVVVFDDADFDYAKKVYQRYPGIPFFLQVGNEHTSGIEKQQLISKLLDRYEWLIQKAMQDDQLTDVRILPQLHTFVWGNKRGV